MRNSKRHQHSFAQILCRLYDLLLNYQRIFKRREKTQKAKSEFASALKLLKGIYNRFVRHEKLQKHFLERSTESKGSIPN